MDQVDEDRLEIIAEPVPLRVGSMKVAAHEPVGRGLEEVFNLVRIMNDRAHVTTDDGSAARDEALLRRADLVNRTRVGLLRSPGRSRCLESRLLGHLGSWSMGPFLIVWIASPVKSIAVDDTRTRAWPRFD